MEQPSKKKRPLRAVLFVLGAIVLLLVAMGGTILIQQSLRPARATAVPTAEPTETPEPTPLPDRSYDSERKPAFVPELDKLGMTDDEIEAYGEEFLAPEYWLDITPDDLRAATGADVIRHIGLGYSYLVLDGTYYRHGKGVLDVLLTDLNNDGTPDMLYTYHFGVSTDAQTKVGWFDFATLHGQLSPFGMQQDFLALNAEGDAIVLYRCTRFVDENGGFALHFTDRLGELVEQSDRLYLMME